MKRLYGVTVAALTPMNEDGSKVDHATIKDYVDFLVEKGVNGIFALGTTGEGLLLSIEERKKTLESFVRAVDGRVVLIAHCGALRIDEVRDLLFHAKSVGADGASIVSPFYYRYRSEELVEFFLKCSKDIEDFPMYLYNIPALTNNWITAEIATKMHKEKPNFVGIKDSSQDLLHVLSLINDTPESFDVVVGSDRAFLTVLQNGCERLRIWTWGGLSRVLRAALQAVPVERFRVCERNSKEADKSLPRDFGRCEHSRAQDGLELAWN
jgi:Dihydrodipicolinate synthase/N-acetylneuraminate lyase